MGGRSHHTEGAGRGQQCLAPPRPNPSGAGRPPRHDLGGILAPDQQAPEVDRIPHDEPSLRRLVARLGDPRRLRACDEAGPTGFELARLPAHVGVGCQVIAPSLTPTAPGDRAKTDTRDCRRLARLHRAGELVAIRIPPSPRKRFGTRAAPAPTWSPTAPARGTGWASSCCATAAPGAAERAPGPRARTLAARPAVRRTSPCRHLRALPGGPARPRRAAGRRRGRPCRLVRPATVRLAGRPAGRLPRRGPARRLTLAAEVGDWS